MGTALRRFLQDWFMPFGLLLFCCGMFVATGRTAYKTMVYLGLLAPAIAMVVLAPKAALQALLGNPLRLAIAVFAFWAASSGSWAVQQGESDSFLKYAVFIVLFSLALSRPVGIGDERLLGVLRLSIALAGIYAVTASVVSQRTREFGVRIALGATAADIRRGVLGRALRHVFYGLAIGLPSAWAISRGFGALFYKVQPTDVSVYVFVGSVILGAGLLAALVPAHRAARVDPIVSLRTG